ncbi:hypothetical protein [Phaeobacter sp. B1627]|uniref:hypothetical protein n=1 Tax=Phaeobacter sp. B1627 TaxID=2583809 RepID=UPI001118A4B9|nr:hypothetical protein [Phaeobacter sp. B1627]TNJ38301.1 hypothetical protein FGE21_19745 [Phaeobacter sp. B1627]
MPKSQEIPLPDLPADTYGKPKGKRYRQQFGVIALVGDEQAQKALFARLTAEGLNCKVVNT